MPAGVRVRGHEFHYSEWVRDESDDTDAYVIKPRGQDKSILEGFAKGNLLASFVHIHFASQPDLAGSFVLACERWG